MSKLPVEVISGLKPIDYRLIKLYMDLHVRLECPDEEIKEKENLIFDGNSFAEKPKQKCSFNLVSLE